MSLSVVLEIHHTNKVREFPLIHRITSIGRGIDNDIVVDDEQVSRHHVKVEFSGDMLHITDLNSSNGTTLNNSKIQPMTPLPVKDGDTIGIGSSIVIVRLSDAAQKLQVPSTQDREVADVSGIPVTIARTRTGTYAETPSASPYYRKKFSRRKIFALSAGVVVLIGVILVVSLRGPAVKADIETEIVESFMQLNTTALNRIDSEMDEIVQELHDTEVKLMKLKQVVDEANNWVDLQKEQQQKNEEFPVDAYVTEEGLDELKNEIYQVTTLKVTSTPDEQLSATIRVTDLTREPQVERDWKDIEDELKSHKSTLEQQWLEKADDGQLATTTFQEVTKYWEDWEIKKVSSDTYSVSGPGLGWSEGQLTTGQWIYHQDTGTIKPTNSQSFTLNEMLSIKL